MVKLTLINSKLVLMNLMNVEYEMVQESTLWKSVFLRKLSKTFENNTNQAKANLIATIKGSIGRIQD